MQTWLGWGTLNIKEFLDTAWMSNADRESGSASSNYTPHPWGGKDIPPHFPFWVPASLWNVLWGTVWCLKGQDTSNDLWVGGSCMIWIHLLIPPQMLKMSNGHVTQEQLSKSIKTSQNFGQPHSCRPTESPQKSQGLCKGNSCLYWSPLPSHCQTRPSPDMSSPFPS